MLMFILGLMLVGALLILAVMLTEMVVFVRSRVPFVPTNEADLLDLVKKLPITSSDYVYDLGSGNGKVIFTIEQATGARVKGFQYSGWTQWYAKLKKFFTQSKAELISGNFHGHSWSEATVIYAYLYPPLMAAVGQKIIAECKPGTKIVIRDFPIPNLELTDLWLTPSNHTMHLYIVP